MPHGSVAIWNVYDHGVNNAEGALRWPSEVYRLNGSLAAGKAAMRLLTSQLDKYQGQVQGTSEIALCVVCCGTHHDCVHCLCLTYVRCAAVCADEVFCGRDPERGTETCTVSTPYNVYATHLLDIHEFYTQTLHTGI